MSDHWGGFDHHDDDGLPDFSDVHDLPDTHDEPHTPDLDTHDDDYDHHDTPAADHHDDDVVPDLPDPHDTTATADDTDFPPTLDVGDLPEPVDGFPWVDAATLGTPDTYDAPTDPVDPHELAAYAGVDVPDGTDPWTALTASDDPAVAALARWWTPDEQ